MKAKNIPIAVFFCLVCFLSPPKAFADPPRSFDSIFPRMGESQKREVFSEGGYIQSYGKNEPLQIVPVPGSGITILDDLLKKKPTYLAESLVVVPYAGRQLTKLDAYNALGKIRDLKGRQYRSYSKGAVPLFEDATRIESPGKNNPIPDPPPARTLPSSETVYIRLKDANFGNSFYKGTISATPYGLTYTLTNFKNLTYLVMTVMKEEKFTAILYMEPLAEGMMIYSLAGADASDFIAGKVHIPTAISKRLEVFVAWICDWL